MSTKSGPFPAEVRAHRYLELDSLRGLAAITVVFYHFNSVFNNYAADNWTHWPPITTFFAGHEAVIFFFVLSGFVLSVPYSEGKAASYAAYLTKRFCRLYLPFMASVLLAQAGAFLLYAKSDTGNAWMDVTWSTRPTLHMLLRTLLLSNQFASQNNPVIWTILLEIRVSVIFPLLYLITRKFGGLIVLPFFIIAPILLNASHYNEPRNLRLVCTSGLFVMGILLQRNLKHIYALYHGLSPVKRWLCFAVALVAFECTCPLYLYLGWGDSLLRTSLCDYIVGIGATVIVVFALANKRIQDTLLHPVLIRGGALSYSIYLTHSLVLFALIRLFFGKMHFLMLLPVYLLLAYALAELFHWAIDQRCVYLGRRASKSIQHLWPRPTPNL